MTDKDMDYKQHEIDLLKEFVEWLKDRYMEVDWLDSDLEKFLEERE